MQSTWLMLVTAALAGALVALLVAWLAWRAWGRKALDAELLRVQDEFERRVKKGVLAAGEELLPAFRENVAQGFRDALRESQAAGIAESTAKIVAGGTDLLKDSLSNLLGYKKK